MTDATYTDITLIWDRSGSMAAMGKEPIGAYQGFIDTQKEVAGKCHVSLLFFDHAYEYICQDVPLERAPALDGLYWPRGNTALFDAIGRAIGDAGDRFSRMAEAERPGKVIFVILTDGLENSSKDWTRDKLREAVERQTKDYGWSFVYLGKNEQAFKDEAHSFGTQSAQMATYTGPEGLAKAVRGTAANVASYRAHGVGGQSLGGSWGENG